MIAVVQGILVPTLQLALAVYLLGRTLPLRAGSHKRTALLALCLVAFGVLAIAYGLMRASADSVLASTAITSLPTSTVSSGIGVTIAIYGVILAISIGVFLGVFDTGVWPALFCCTCGYTMQNLTSSICEMVYLLRETQLVRVTCTLLVTCAVYGMCERLIMSKIHRDGLEHVSGGLLALGFALVFFLIIGFDATIKCLGFFVSVNASQATLLTTIIVILRVVHWACCAVLLLLEYELLYNGRLLTEASVMRSIVAEQRRRYQLTKESVEAVNRRMHDIRHDVVGSLATAETPIDRELLAGINSKIKAYDLQIHTGNEALDTVLGNKMLECSAADVQLICMADGALLAFMEPVDVYLLFDALLEQALAQARNYANADDRCINVTVHEAMGMAYAQVDWYRPAGAAAGVDASGSADVPGEKSASTGAGAGLSTTCTVPAEARQVVSRYEGAITFETTPTASRFVALLPL